MNVYTVEVFEDGIYVFANKSGAERFQEAYNKANPLSATQLTEQAVCDAKQTDALIALIAVELDES